MADVLVCAGDSGPRRLLEAALTGEGLTVEAFSCVSEAAAPCLRRKYKVAVICLERIETETWIEPLRILRQIDPFMPLVVLCKLGDLEMERKLRSAGIFYLLSRPLATDELRAVVKCAIGKHNKESTLK